MDTHARPRLRPAWLPTEGRIEAVAAGVHWDAIAISGPLGGQVLAHLREAAPDGTGPVLHDSRSHGGRTYFLVPAGTATTWRERGTDGLGSGAVIGMPVSLDTPAVGLSWLQRPDAEPEHVDVALLRQALLTVRDGGRP